MIGEWSWPIRNTQVKVRAEFEEKDIEISFSTGLEGTGWIVHWGHANSPTEWLAPPDQSLPPGSFKHGAAFQTPFDGDDETKIARFTIPAPFPKGILFVIAKPKDNLWLKDKGKKNFYFTLEPNVQNGTQSSQNGKAAPPKQSSTPAPPPKESSTPMPLKESASVKPSAPPTAPPSEAPGRLQEEITDDMFDEDEPVLEQAFNMVGGDRAMEILARVDRKEENNNVYVRVVLQTDRDTANNFIFHWGVAQKTSRDWSPPNPSYLPKNTRTVDGGKAMQTSFEIDESMGKGVIRFVFSGTTEQAAQSGPVEGLPYGIVFVGFQPNGNKWLKEGRTGNGFIPIRQRPTVSSLFKLLKQVKLGRTAAQFVQEIVSVEMEASSWTLMHRYNLCHDFVSRVLKVESEEEAFEAWCVLFVWLRFSALRQLDWQRNYHTKPRELSSAQLRLTSRLAEVYADKPKIKWLIQLIMGTVGRGGSSDLGQQIRDGILIIIQKHNRGWGKGSFMEEWHQKLHNNTTPDDCVIGDAYLAFLRSNGNLKVFYDVLNAGGVTRERMAAYEQPIFADPDFVGHIKDGLYRDIEDFVRILKAVHLGTDVATAVDMVKGSVDPGLRGQLDAVKNSNWGNDPINYIMTLTEARAKLFPLLQSKRGDLRDLIFLDLALQTQLRVVVEAGGKLAEGSSNVALQANLILQVLRNVTLIQNPVNDDMSVVLKEWRRLAEGSQRYETQWFLRAKATLDKVTRSMHAVVDKYYILFQDKAELLGSQFHAQEWTVELFTEEMVRGSPFFVLSVILRRFNPALRKGADMGPWQVISPGHSTATGRLAKLTNLETAMEQRSDLPKIILTDKVGGDEEPPDWVVAVISAETPDILSHVAVRARNMHLLFVSCYDEEILFAMRKLEGKDLTLKLSARGDLSWELCKEPVKPIAVKEKKPTEEATTPDPDSARPPRSLEERRKSLPGTFGRRMSRTFSGSQLANRLLKRTPSTQQIQHPPSLNTGPFAVPMDAFNKDIVGSKSFNILGLHKFHRDALPSWINVPKSAALPFGTCERVLADPLNREPLSIYMALEMELLTISDGVSTLESRDLLAKLQGVVMSLQAPAELQHDLNEVLNASDLAIPTGKWDDAWSAIKSVWASKWSDRAFASRVKYGMRHDALYMAVLCQRVAEAEYAFVIHTKNPITEDDTELYAEVVCGLGETLVGNYPGRAFSFSCPKSNPKGGKILSYPSKNECLYGGGLIFRSDSNGEDLEGYAGAGLYESVLMLPVQSKSPVDYSQEPLTWNNEFQQSLMTKITEIGIIIEKALNFPQDIEGCIEKGGKYYVVQTRPQV